MRTGNEQLLLSLSDLPVTFGRPAADRSLLLEDDGDKVLPLFTNKELMARWWRARSGDDLPTRSMTFRTMLANWRAADVDIVLNPGNDAEVRIPITEARRVLRVATTRLEPGVEPLPDLQLPFDPMDFTRKVVIPVGALLLVVVGLLIDEYLFAVIGAILLLASLVSQLRRRRQRAG